MLAKLREHRVEDSRNTYFGRKMSIRYLYDKFLILGSCNFNVSAYQSILEIKDPAKQSVGEGLV